MDEAVKKQQDLLAEFEKVADEMKKRPGGTRREHAGEAAQGGRAVAVQGRRPARRAGEPELSACGAAICRRRQLQRFGRNFGAGDQRGRQGLADHGRHGGLFRPPSLREDQVGPRRHAQAGRDRQPAAVGRRPQDRKRPVDRPVRILVRHARPLGRGSRRPRLQRIVHQLQSRKGACRRRSCWKCCRFSKGR